MPKLENALNTMLDSMMSGLVLGQPLLQIKRGGMALSAVRITGRSLTKATITASTFDLQMDPVDEDGGDSDPVVAMEVKVRTRSSLFHPTLPSPVSMVGYRGSRN